MSESVPNAPELNGATLPPVPPTEEIQSRSELDKQAISAKLSTLEEQRELFLWKHHDISRQDVNDLLKDFKKFDIGHKGELEYHEILRMLELRGTVMTAAELMGMIGEMDHDHNGRITFLEWCCTFYMKSYDDMFVYIDEEARQQALQEAYQFSEEARKAEEEIERAKRQKELQAQLRAAALERESKMTGVQGMRAFFGRAASEGAVNIAKTNEQQIKEEAARRKALRDAKAKMNEAIVNANKVKTAEDIAKEIQRATIKAAAEEAAAKQRQMEDEKQARLARKAALNAKWSGSSMPTTPAK